MKRVLYFFCLSLLFSAGFVVWKNYKRKKARKPAVFNVNSDDSFYGYATFGKISELPLEELSNYTNVIGSMHEVANGLPDEEDLERLRDFNLKLFLKLDKTVVEESFDEDQLLFLKDKIDRYQDVIYALCPVDEPYKESKGYSYAYVEEIVQKTKDIFPNYLIHVNFLNPKFIASQNGDVHPGIPENIDIISTDIYFSYPEEQESFYLDMIGQSLEILREEAGERPVFFVSKGSGPVDDSTKFPTDYQAEWDYQLFQEYDLSGLMWYFYNETAPGGANYGSCHFPEVVSKQIEIGQSILGIDDCLQKGEVGYFY